jgi:tRNA (Thr-GGU) A37 N-methylase
MLDGTPVLDIKPYFPMVREEDEVRIGWIEGKQKRFDSEESDERFE